MKSDKKFKRLATLIVLGFLMAAIFNITNIIMPTTKNPKNSNDKDIKDTYSLKEPEQISPETNSLQELSGQGSTLGIYGYTNGTYGDDMSYTDGWTNIGGGIIASPEYSVNTPASVAGQPWQVKGGRVEVSGLTDKKNYLPDTNFSSSFVSITAISAGWDDGDYVDIIIDGTHREIGGRGINLVRLNSGGTFIYANVYDTYADAAQATSLANYINGCNDGDIIILAIEDEGTNNLANAYDAITNIGSSYVRDLGLRDSWVLISIIGKGKVAEKWSQRNNGVARVDIDLTTKWNTTTANPEGLQYWWKLDEISGTTVNNEGQADNGVGTAYGDLIMGKVGARGTCYEFDGADDYVDIPDANLPVDLDGDLTISFWIKPENIGVGRINPLDKSYGGEFALTLETDGLMHYYHGTQRTSGYYIGWTAFPSGTFQNGKWYHVVITRDVSTRTLKSYLNGKLSQTGTWSSSADVQPSTSTYPIRIGLGYTGVYFKGKVDDVRIYTRTLDVNEIQYISQDLDPDRAQATIKEDGTYGQIGQIHFDRALNKFYVDNFDKLPIVSSTGSPTRDQEQAKYDDSGDVASASMTKSADGSTYYFQSRFDSYAYQSASDSDGWLGGGSCSAVSNMHINDQWNPIFTTEADLITIDNVAQPHATIHFEINYDNSFSFTEEEYGYSGNQGIIAGNTQATTDIDVTIQMWIIDPNNQLHQILSTPYQQSFSRTTSDFTAGNKVYDEEISDIFSLNGTYKLRLQVSISHDSYYALTAQDTDDCWSLCSVSCSSSVWGQTYNRIKLYISNIDFQYEDVAPLMDGNVGFETTYPMDFQGREVQSWQDGQLTFQYLIDNNLIGYEKGGSEYGLQDSKVAAWLTIDGTTYEYVSSNNLYLERGSLQTFTASIDGSLLNGAHDLYLKIGVKVSNMILNHSVLNKNSNIYIYNPKLILIGKPNIEDINLQIAPGSHVLSGSVVSFTGTSKGAGYADVSTWVIDLAAGSFGARFRTTSLQLNFTFTHRIELFYEDWGTKTTTFHIKSDGYTDFYANFSITTPYGDPSNFLEPYQQNFYYDIIFPRFVYKGEPYWDLISASVDGHTKTILGEENITELDTNYNIFVKENYTNPYGDYPNTMQYATVFNDVFDEWIQTSSQTLGFNILFRSPNFMSGIQISNSTPVVSDTDIFIAGQNNLYIKGTLVERANEGNASLAALKPDNSVIGKQFIANVKGLTTFQSADSGDPVIVIDGSIASSTDYAAYAAYTAENIANVSTGKVCIGIYKGGFKQINFEVKRDAIVNGPYINKLIYDTTKDSGLITIKVNFYDEQSGTPIIDATATITVGEFYAEGTESKKRADYYNSYGWVKNTPMVNLGNGSYIIYIDPSRNPDGSLAGNMSWGWHNFTIHLSKEGYLSKEISGNFSIIIDTYLQWWTPYHEMAPTQPWPHFMGSQPAGDPITFSIRFMINDSEAGSPIYNDTGLYNGMVHINYTLVNTTAGLVNWSAIQSLIGQGYNPINGSFHASESASVYEATIMWPTFDSINETVFPRYVPDIILEYNVTAWVERNTTIVPDATEPNLIKSTFQPDHLEKSWCENESTPGFDGYGSKYKLVEETLRIQLVEYASVNKTSFTLLNNPDDTGHAFDMGYFDNISDTNGVKYIVRNFYKNNTHRWFRLRGKFNCTHILRNTEADPAPPVGPLNHTNIFYGKKLNWAGNTTIKLVGDISAEFIPDYTNTWTIEVNHTLADGSPGTPINVTGCTYVTPKIWFSNYSAGTYSCTIVASKGGFETSYVPITIVILPQNTTLYNSSGSVIDTTHPIRLTVPRWNQTSFIIQWNDTTNNIPEEINSIDNIECYDDSNKEIYKNGTGNGYSWGWTPLGNGKYKITFKYTDITPSTDPIHLLFRINKQNYSSSEFKVLLTIRKRNATLHLVWMKHGGVGVYDQPYYPTLQHAHIVLSYEIWDEDNRTNGVRGTNLVKLTPTEIADSFNIEYFDWKWANISVGGRWRYNITIGTNRPVGNYIVNFTISGLLNYITPIVNKEAHIKIANVSTNITLITTGKVSREFVHYSESTTSLNIMPKFQFVYWDENHSQTIGLSGVSVSGNWTNSWSNSLDDIYLVDEGNGQGSIYFDIQMVPVKETPYFVLVYIEKSNYETIKYLFNFTIVNQTTHFSDDQVQYGTRIYNQGGSILISDTYDENKPLSLYWGTRIKFQFTFESYKGVLINDDPSNGLPASVTLMGIPAELTYTVNNLGSGIWDFELDFSQLIATGTVNIEFNISASAANFEKYNFGVNLTISDRPCYFEILSQPDKELYWTEPAEFIIQFIDWEYISNLGTFGHYYIEGALINGSSTGGNISFKNGSITTNWQVNELTQGKYLISINTTALQASDYNYFARFNISKPHWDFKIIVVNFTVHAVPFEISIDVSPREDFEIAKVDTLTISVSLYVWLFGEKKEVNIDYTIENIKVLYKLYDSEDKEVASGELKWSSGAKKFIVEISTEDLLGIHDLYIIVESNNPNFQTTTSEAVKLLGIGEGEATIPWWFWILFGGVVAAALGIAGYGIKKAIYLRIPYILRKIDETIKKIEKDKYPAVGVMTGRSEFIINSILDFLETCGIEWEREDKFEIKKVGEGAAKEKLPPLNLEQIKAALDEIPDLSEEEKILFIDELKRLDRDAQEEFLKSLRGDIEE
ncbi:MAG: LamG-like jellyroll fold domain-containing protein [Candidatus Helarchaeota archaeon]